VPATGGPVGRWENLSATGWGQVFGVRGITWTFHGDGRLEFLLADAFAGPPDALAMAEEVGTSGLVPGRWAVSGPREVRLSRLDTTGLSMHGRTTGTFAMPAGAMGMGQVLQAMQDGPWTWRTTGDELYLEGRMMGGPVQMRFRRASRA